MTAVRVAGSLWSVPASEQERALRDAAAAGLATVHWDHTDGAFAAAGGFEVPRAAELTRAVPGLRAEAHLMVRHPVGAVDGWTDFCERVVVHAEATDHRAALRRIERRGRRPALAVSPGTAVAPFVSDELPLLIMSVVPGEAGTRFRAETFERIRQVRAGSAGSRSIGVDGGVDAALARTVVRQGADWVVSGTALFGTDDVAGWLEAVA